MIIEIIDIECGLLSCVSLNIVTTIWQIYKGKLTHPRTFYEETKWHDGVKIQYGGFIRAKTGKPTMSTHSISIISMVITRNDNESFFLIFL